MDNTAVQTAWALSDVHSIDYLNGLLRTLRTVPWRMEIDWHWDNVVVAVKKKKKDEDPNNVVISNSLISTVPFP
jgi:hypothetical protein